MPNVRPGNDFKFPVKTLIGGVAGVIIGVTALSNIYFVQPYERVVVTRAGTFQTVFGPGVHFTTPFLSSTKTYDIRVQELDTPKMNTYTIDNQEVDANVSVQFTLPSDEKGIQNIYTNVGDAGRKLLPLVIGEWKKVGGQVNVSDIASKRGEITNKLYDTLAKQAKELYGLTITNVQITELTYQDAYRTAQNNASIVKTQIEQAEGMKQKAVIEAETAKIEASGRANQAIETARGASESVKLNADALAHQIQVEGEAKATAQSLMAKALSQNPSLVDYERALRWNGVLPQNIYAGTPIPFLNSSK